MDWKAERREGQEEMLQGMYCGSVCVGRLGWLGEGEGGLGEGEELEGGKISRLYTLAPRTERMWVVERPMPDEPPVSFPRRTVVSEW